MTHPESRSVKAERRLLEKSLYQPVFIWIPGDSELCLIILDFGIERAKTVFVVVATGNKVNEVVII